VSVKTNLPTMPAEHYPFLSGMWGGGLSNYCWLLHNTLEEGWPMACTLPIPNLRQPQTVGSVLQEVSRYLSLIFTILRSGCDSD